MFKTILVLCFFHTITCAFELTIVHTNDVHARFEPFTSRGAACKGDINECYGGVVRRGSYVKQVRARESNVLLLDAGDQFQGTPWFFTYKGVAASFFLNELNYTAMALGNHEFDNGVEGLKQFFLNVTVPMLCANLIMDNVLERKVDEAPKFLKDKVKEHMVVDFEGTRVGIIGYLTSEVPTLSRTGNLTFEDEAKAIRKVAQELTLNGTKIIIAVGHAGLKKDEEMAASIPEVDVFVGGHSHSFLYNGTPPTEETVAGSYPIVIERTHSKALVVQAGLYGKYVGTLKVTFDDRGRVSSWSGNPVLMDSSIPDDEDLQQKMDQLNDKVEDLYKQVVGSTAMNFDTENNICRIQECELGNLYADAMMDYMNTHEDWNADLALFNSGSIGASLAEGNVTYGDAMTVFPFNNEIVIVSLLGSHLKQVFEHSIKDFSLESKHGKFLQVSKEGYVLYSFYQPEGQRVLFLSVFNKTRGYEVKVSDDKWYRIVVPSFLAKGGDGYEVLKENAKDLLSIDVQELDIFLAYLKKYSPIKAKLESRIMVQLVLPRKDDEEKKAPSTQKVKSENNSCVYHATLLIIITSVFATLFA